MFVTLLTDYGREDDFVGVCHAVILGIHPQAQIMDLSHGIARHGVRLRPLFTASDLLSAAKGAAKPHG